MLDDRFYPPAGGVERHLPVRSGSSVYALLPEDGSQRETSNEVDNAWDLRGRVDRSGDASFAAVAAAEAEFSATFMPLFQRASGLPQQHQQHHPYHGHPSPESSARGSGTDGDVRARSTAVRGAAGDFASPPHSQIGWEKSSDGRRSYSTDARTMAHRVGPQGADLGASLGRHQEWEVIPDRQQSSGSDCNSGDSFVSRGYNSLAEEHYPDRFTSRMGGLEPQRNLATHRYHRTSGPTSAFHAQQPHQRKETRQPVRGAMGLEGTFDDGFSGCNNNRDADYHSRGWGSHSQLRAMTSPTPAQQSEGPPAMGTLYSLESSSPPPPSSPSFGRRKFASPSTPRLQNCLDSRLDRSLGGTHGSRMRAGYDDLLERQQQQQRSALAARSSMSTLPSWAEQRQHGGADSINTLDRDRGDHEELLINGRRGQVGNGGRGVYTGNMGSGSGVGSSSSFSSERLNTGRGHHQHRQHHQHQHHQHHYDDRHQQQDKTTSGDAFHALRRAPAPHYTRIHHDDQHQIDCLPTVPYRSEGDITRRASTRTAAPTIASLSMADGQHQHHDGGSFLPRGRADAKHGCDTDDFDGGNPAAVTMAVRSPQVAPAFSTPAPAPGSPFEWLKKLNLRQSSYGKGSYGTDESTDTPSTASSSSATSTSSSFGIGTADGGGDEGGGGIHAPPSDGAGQHRADVMAVGGQGAVAMTAAHGMCSTCPAPDCPGNGDCLPGATPDMLVYEVQFKRAIRTFLPGEDIDATSISCGVLMKVEADRGEDLGIVHRSLRLSEYLHAQNEERKAKAAKIAENGGGGGAGDGSESKKKRNKSKKAEEDGGGKNGAKRRQQNQNQVKPEEPQEKPCPVRAINRILRPATPKELQQLQEKTQQEVDVLRVCQHKVRQRSLPMKIVDAEYQFDMHKLTLFFEAERRIDFRELVRDLFAVYKTRIWMQQVKDKDAATRSGARAAAVAAATSTDSDGTASPTASPDNSDDSSGAHQDRDKGMVSHPSFAGGGSFFALAFPPDVGYDVGYGSGSSSSGGGGGGGGGD